MRKNPGFAGVAIITLALGIGANTAIFSLVNAALLRPLPYQAPDRLVYVWSAEKARGINQSTVSIADLHDWREQNGVFEGLAGWWSGSYNLSGGYEPQQVGGWTVSPNFFEVLGARAELGRTFARDEQQLARDRVVVLSHSLWIGPFGGDPRILGKSIIVDGEPHNVIGVMPAEFSSPFPDVQLWLPWPARAESIAARGDRFLRVIARLKPGVTIEHAQADMETIARKACANLSGGRGRYRLSGSRRAANYRKGAASVACPARRHRLCAFDRLCQSGQLAAGKVSGATERVCRPRGIGRRPFGRSAAIVDGERAAVGMRGRRGSFTGCRRDSLPAVGSRNTGSARPGNRFGRSRPLVHAGVVPAHRSLVWTVPRVAAVGGELNESLKEAGRGSGTGVPGRKVRDLLVVCEMALAVMLLAGAGLLVNSFQHLRSIAPGFNPDKVLTCQVSLPSKYKNPQIAAFFHQLLDRIRALPGVKAAGATMTMPLQNPNGGYWSGLNIQGHPLTSRASVPIVSFAQVTPGYIRAMGIPLLKGREFNERDNQEQSPKVAIINAALARLYFADIDPIGRRISLGEDASKGPWLTVVGVVGDAAIESLTDPRFPQVFSPHAQGVEGGVAGDMELALRTFSDPLSLAAAVRNAVHELDKDQSVAKIQTLGQVVSASLAQPRLNTLLLAGFAVLALLLAAVGIYGVISYSVAMRTREIGIRTALGAARIDVLKLVVQHGMRLALAGGAIGLAGGLILVRLMSSLVYGVRLDDPPTFVAALAVLMGVALFAAYIPARRAAKIDPLLALRQE
jgi:hypothetical protein